MVQSQVWGSTDCICLWFCLELESPNSMATTSRSLWMAWKMNQEQQFPNHPGVQSRDRAERLSEVATL
jgi:hypothetical protein